MSAAASEAVLFIFQLPAMTVFLMVFIFLSVVEFLWFGLHRFFRCLCLFYPLDFMASNG